MLLLSLYRSDETDEKKCTKTGIRQEKHQADEVRKYIIFVFARGQLISVLPALFQAWQTVREYRFPLAYRWRCDTSRYRFRSRMP